MLKNWKEETTIMYLWYKCIQKKLLRIRVHHYHGIGPRVLTVQHSCGGEDIKLYPSWGELPAWAFTLGLCSLSNFLMTEFEEIIGQKRRYSKRHIEKNWYSGSNLISAYFRAMQAFFSWLEGPRDQTLKQSDASKKCRPQSIPQKPPHPFNL